MKTLKEQIKDKIYSNLELFKNLVASHTAELSYNIIYDVKLFSRLKPENDYRKIFEKIQSDHTKYNVGAIVRFLLFYDRKTYEGLVEHKETLRKEISKVVNKYPLIKHLNAYTRGDIVDHIAEYINLIDKKESEKTKCTHI
jgi:hypothetical protein